MEGGSYLLNFKGCAKCSEFAIIKIANKKRNEEGDLETVTYTHHCPKCDHVICDHKYTFEVNGDYQEYNMECMLCGIGEATISIEPEDPRKMAALDM